MNTDKIACITGASSGIGEATAHALLDLGYRLIVMARREEKLQQVARDLELKGATVLPIILDVRDSNAVEAAFTALPHNITIIDNG